MANGTEYYRGIKGLRPTLPELPAGIYDWKPDEYAALERLRKAGVQNPEKLAQWETYAPMEKAARAYVPRVAGAVPDEQQLKRQVVQSLGRGRVTPAMLESLGRMQQATNEVQKQRLAAFQEDTPEKESTVSRARRLAQEQRDNFLKKGGGSVAERRDYQAREAMKQAEARRAARGAEDFRLWQERKKFMTDEVIRQEEAKIKTQVGLKEKEITAKKLADIETLKERMALQSSLIDKKFGNDKAMADIEKANTANKILLEAGITKQRDIFMVAKEFGLQAIKREDGITILVPTPHMDKVMKELEGMYVLPQAETQVQPTVQPEATATQQGAMVNRQNVISTIQKLINDGRWNQLSAEDQQEFWKAAME